VVAGSNAAFTVAAIGNSQSRIDGFLTVNRCICHKHHACSHHVQSTNTGNYIAVATNPVGSITSTVAVLTVTSRQHHRPANEPKRISRSNCGFHRSRERHGALVLSMAVQWDHHYPNGTNAVLTVANVQSADAGDYLVRVTNTTDQPPVHKPI